MKAIRFITQLLITFVLFACTEENVLQQQIVDKGEGIRIIADFADTRTSYEDDGEAIHVAWNKNDRIGVFSKSKNNLLYIAEEDGATTEFLHFSENLTGEEGEEIIAYYPYVESDGNEGLPLPNPHQMYWKNNNFESMEVCDFLYAKGVVKNNEVHLSFKHAFAFLKITIPVDKLVDPVFRRLYIQGIDIDYIDDSDFPPTFDVETESVKGRMKDYTDYNIPSDEDLEGLKEITCYVRILPQPEGGFLTIYNKNQEKQEYAPLFMKEIPKGGLKAGHVYEIDLRSSENDFYTSTDYSRDGECVVLQKATVGKGVNLVFMGDGFVDKDMEPGGRYEQKMTEAMEIFFAYEPYRSLRNRFNVYTIKMVSPHGVWGAGTKHVLGEGYLGENFNQEPKKCFEYTDQMLDRNALGVVLLFNNELDFHMKPNGDPIVSQSWRYEADESFIATCSRPSSDLASYLIHHEAGGHGFAKLEDEYIVYVGDHQVPDSQKEYYDRLEQRGWADNVDYDNNPETIKWAHMLKDPRYKDEVGIWEGAAYYSTGFYRPSEYSFMNASGRSYYNAPSRESIYKHIMSISEGPGWTYDFEEFAKFDEPYRNSLKATRGVWPVAPSEEMRKAHVPPIFMEGTWHDAINQK